jgi:pyruvate dehydrogenase E1 component
MGPFATVKDPDALKAFLGGPRSSPRAGAATPTPACRAGDRDPTDREISTQMAFGKILDDLAKGDSELAARILTTSPDVTGTTNLGPWVNRRKLFARERRPTRSSTSHPLDREMGVHTRRPAYRARHRGDEPVPAAGRGGPVAFSLFGKRLIPIGTVYDPFVPAASMR